jgi:hypothetical protein
LLEQKAVTSEYTRQSERYGWSFGCTELLGAALLRLEMARELARVRLRHADQATLDRWTTHEIAIEQWLDVYERRIAEAGELGVSAAVRGIRSLELEVCEFIPAPLEPSPDARHVIEPFAYWDAHR